MLALRRKLDQGAIIEFVDLNALGGIAALVDEPAQVRAGFAQLLAEFAVGDLEATHGRPAVFGIVGGSSAELPFNIGQIGARRPNLLIQCATLRIGDGAVGSSGSIW